MRRQFSRVLAASLVALAPVVMASTQADAQARTSPNWNATFVVSNPYGAAFDGTHLWVSSPNNSLVEELDFSGSGVVSPPILKEISLVQPSAVTYADGFIWVESVDSGVLYLNQIDPNGAQGAQPIHRVAITGADANMATTITWDGSHVWVASMENLTEISVSKSGVPSVISTLTGVTSGASVFWDGSHLWAPEGGTRIIEYSVNATSGATQVGEVADLHGPQGMTFDGTHDWVANLDGTVSKISGLPGSLSLSTVQVASVNNTSGNGNIGGNSFSVAFDGKQIWVALITGTSPQNIASVSLDGLTVTPLELTQGETLGSGAIYDFFDGQHMWFTEPADGTVDELALPPVVPAAPTALKASLSGTTVSLSWQAPSFSGYTAITGYTVTANPGGLSCTATTTSCTISGLAKGKTYTVSVVATNEVGNSPASPTVSVAVPTPSSTPSTVPVLPNTGSDVGAFFVTSIVSVFGGLLILSWRRIRYQTRWR